MVHNRFRVALLGDGVRLSLTPRLHLEEAAQLDIGYEYDAWDLLEPGHHGDDPEELLNEVETAGYDAVNVTHPLKQRVMPFLDELSDEASMIGAVNLILFRGGRRLGHNTDAEGFGDGLREGLPDSPLTRVLQLGAGGAGAAVAYALLSAGVEQLSIADAESARAVSLADRYRAVFPDRRILPVSLGDERELATTKGLVNATPVGMHIHPGTPADVSLLQPDAWVADVIYRPVNTELIIAARESGHRTLDGGRMAVGQAVASMRLIAGVEPDAERMRRHFLELLAVGA